MKATTTLVGRLARAPKAFGTEGKEVAIITVACNGSHKDEAEFYTVKAFGKTAANACKYLDKGSQVAIQASLSTYKNEKYKDADGHSPTMVEIIANRIEFLGGGKKPHASQDPVQAPAQTPSDDGDMKIDDLDW